MLPTSTECIAETETAFQPPFGRDASRARVLVVSPIPTPYRDPFWEVVGWRSEIDLEVVFCSAGKSDRPWVQDWGHSGRLRSLPGYNLARWFGDGASCYWNPEILRLLRQRTYDAVIIGGYNHLTMLAVVAYARYAKIPYGLMSEVYLRQPRSGWRRLVKAPLVKSIVRRARGCLPTGTLASEYLVHYGANPERLCHIPNVPDVEAIHRQVGQLQPRKAELKHARGLGEKPVILFVSRLIELKRVDLLLDAAQQLLKERDVTVVILGDGPLRQKLEAHTRHLGIAAHVRFEGFIQPRMLPEWYAVADLFVLPSIDETWSVVVLEALSAGVPVVITEMVGCYADVINDPRVGSVVPAGSSSSLQEAMRRHLTNPVPREELMDIWQPVRQSLSYSVIADRFVRTVCAWKRTSCDPHENG